MILIKHNVLELLTRTGRAPFRAWINSLPITVAARVQARLYSAELGNLGDFRAVGGGVFELRIHLGPGYRVYFGRTGAHTLVVILGGSKGTQARDIKKAKRYWTDYTESNHD